MLAVKHDSDGKIIAYVEYFIVDIYGKLDDKGRFCYVRDLWIHKTSRRNGIVRDFINIETKKYPDVKRIYWKRHKYGERMKEFDLKNLVKEK